MSQESKLGSNLAGYSIRVLTLAVAAMIFGLGVWAQDREIANKLQGVDSYMEQVLKDWNTPGIGVGIVINDKLVFAKGYGYRDYEKKLPFTPTTLCQIASNSKLFTAVAAGVLGEGGKARLGKAPPEAGPTIPIYNNHINSHPTFRVILSRPPGGGPPRFVLCPF